MKSKLQSDNEVSVEMDKIDRLELEGGISAAPSRSTKTGGELKSKVLEDTKKMGKTSKDRAFRFVANGPEDW